MSRLDRAESETPHASRPSILAAMGRLIPTRLEMVLFATVAAVCSIIVSFIGATDGAILLAALPIFCVAAFMGVRRSGQWAYITRSGDEEG